MYEELFDELQDKYGELEEFHVCENLGEHLAVNKYIS
jgi:hypothetical protein